MTDRELLELAAKAAGIKVKGVFEDEDTLLIKPAPGLPPARWNPLTDDGDALRLAVKLKIGNIYALTQWAEHEFEDVWKSYEADPYAATRRAIVRAAAEIGKATT